MEILKNLTLSPPIDVKVQQLRGPHGQERDVRRVSRYRNVLLHVKVKRVEKKTILVKYIFNNCLYFCQEANTVQIFSKTNK